MPNLTPTFVVPILVLTDTSKFWSFPGIAYDATRGIVIVIYEDSNGDGLAGSTLAYETSADGGATWGPRLYPIPGPAPNHLRGVGSIVASRTGRWILTWKDADAATGANNITSWVQYSDNAGATWSTPQPLVGFSQWTFSTGPAVQTALGTLLFAAYGNDTTDPLDNSHTRTGVFRSTDDGVTWVFHRISVTDDDYSETGLVQLPDGTVRAYIRNDHTNTFAVSEDSGTDGTAWGTPVVLGAFTMWPSMPGVIRVPGSSQIIVFYRQEFTEHAVWRWSDDLGVTWSAEQVYSAAPQAYAALAPLGPNLVIGAISLIIDASHAYVSIFTMRAGASLPAPVAWPFA